ncbi:alpha-L-fucosidase [Winogradskyella eckloniae]|nr:alpha-L-fucosidase [Winogradskyella eckloniae]
MSIKKLFIITFLTFSTYHVFSQTQSTIKTINANWESMAELYEVPEWFQDGKIGVWMHWGIPSAIDENRIEDGSHYGRRMYGSETYDARNEADRIRTEKLTEWHTKRFGHPSEFGYEKFIANFKAENFDANAIVKFVKDCGARFIMPVATHHDNFDMYDSFFPWNAVKMGPKKDILKEWKNAAYQHHLKFGVSTHLYWSPRFFRTARKFQKEGTPEWEFFNMDYDTATFASQDSWNQHWYKRCWDLIEKYDPDLFNNDSPYPTIKTGKGLGVKLFSDYLNRDLKENNGKQTTVLSFKNAKQNKAAFTYNLERGMFGEQQKHPWIWATDLSGSWFYRKHSFTKMSLDVLIGNAIDAISKNGIVMINIALKGDGTIPDNQRQMLSGFGAFVNINKEGIYNTRPWKTFGEGPLEIVTKRAGENLKPFSEKDIRFTKKGDNLYAFVLAPPTKDIQIKVLKSEGLLQKNIKDIQLLGSVDKINWKQNSDGLTIKNNFKAITNQSAICFKIITE